MSHTFEHLGLKPELVEAVQRAGFVLPTAIQVQAIPILLEGHDLIGQAQTGTGKTAAFGLPMLQKVRPEGGLQALVLTPTRELALQVGEQLQNWAPQLKILTVYGGQAIQQQIKVLRQGVQVIVATPGRLLDHLERQTLTLEHVGFAVLDEADEMLDIGFEEELNRILDQLSDECQIALFSATFPGKIRALAGRHLAQARRVEIEAAQRTVGNISQYFCVARPGKKAQVLGRLIDHQNPGPTLIFCKTRVDTQTLTDDLRKRGYAAECLHGDMDQAERERVMERFRQNQCRLLVATDIAARGLDVDGITHVFNYDLPWDVEHYVHRVGRTARAGRSGTAISVVEPNQLRHLHKIERESRARFQPLTIPNREQIEAGRYKRLGDRIRLQLGSSDYQQQLGLARSLARDIDPLEVAAAALQELWAHLYAPLAEDVEDELQPSQRSLVWISLSVGSREDVRTAEVVRTMHEETGLSKALLGKIHIEDKRTLIEVPAEKADKVLLDLRRIKFKGKRLKVDLTTPPAPGGFRPFRRNRR